jgi:hypothetical protein
MSNRRRARRRDLMISDLYLVDDVRTVLDNLEPYRCPDCDSTFGQITHHAEQVVSVQVMHDDTCPWWNARAGVAG